jgi:hypothetical protein
MMRRIGLCVVVLLVGAGWVWAQEAEKKAEAKPIAVLGWLLGRVWTADASKMGNGMQRIETRYEWSDNDAYIRFTTHFVFDKGTAKTYDGNLFWDAEKKSLAMWYMAADNSIMQGPMRWDGSVLSAEFRATDFEGKMADLKVEVTRKTNDKYVWALSEKDGTSWKPLASLEYVRMAQ